VTDKIPKGTNKKHFNTSGKGNAIVIDSMLHHLAFHNSLQANIVSTVSSGKIIIANSAACKLLGYSKKELLTKRRADIFDINESSFKKMLKQRTAEGQSAALVIAVKKSGKQLPCEITSAIFMDEDGIKKSITTIADMSLSILKQKNIDTKKERIAAHNIVLARSKQKALKERLDQEIRLKETQIAEAMEEARETERLNIGKELHDNVNQLLGASRLYLTMAKRGGKYSEMYLNRSSEYILIAIEEIRKLTKGLTTDVIKNLGLCVAIDNVARDTMEVNPVKISFAVKGFIENNVTDKFKLNVFRIVQEQMNNILKHANATEVIIRLLQNKETIIISFSDNGVGFDTRKQRKGIGVANIKSRAAIYNGTADFISEPGYGCLLAVSFPITNALLNKILIPPSQVKTM